LRADVDRNYISLIELGKNSPSIRMLYKLCDALDIRPSELLKDAASWGYEGFCVLEPHLVVAEKS
jgi:transcriptional regulator with XRE-family HTH domain